tara:strand:- start:115 stop:996 length:882 start_codon:yes stop_codon:yes gene_type:complete
MAQAKAKEAELQSKENEVVEEKSTLYKNAYHKDLDKEVEDPRQAVQDTDEATPEETGFITKNETQPNHDYKKRYDDLKAHYDRKQNESKQKTEELEAKLRIAEKNKAMANYVPPKTDDELIEFKKKYPDVYDVVETISQKQATRQVESLQKEVETLRKREDDLIVQSAYRELLNAHPDFTETKDTPEFLEWLDGQPPSISDGVTKNNKDSKWAIRVLDLYKADKGLSKSKPKSNASAAESVTRTKAKSVNVDGNTNKKVWKASEIQKMNPAMYEKYEKEIDLAFKEGRIDTRA